MKRAVRNTLCSLSAIGAFTACAHPEAPPSPKPSESTAPIPRTEYDHRVRALADGILRFTQIRPEISYDNSREGDRGVHIPIPNNGTVSLQRKIFPGTNILNTVSISKQGDPHQSANIVFSHEPDSTDGWTLTCDDHYNKVSASSDGKLSISPDKPLPGEAVDARQQSLTSAEVLLKAVVANDEHMINNVALSCSPSK